MTLLERDREKIEEGEKIGIEKGKIQGEIEGIELAKRVFKLFNKGETVESIAKICEISEAKVKEIIE